MAKIVFLQQLPEEWLGVMYLSSMLKSHGHQCDIYVERLEGKDFLQKVISGAPDLVAFSCLTCDYPWALQKAAAVKKESTPLIIMGGTHITLNPDEAISNPGVDMICVGEGELPITELADAVESGGEYGHIKNLWTKKGGKVVKNEIRNLIEELDALPHADRGLYAKYPFFRNRGIAPVQLGRGCPFRCKHCHNAGQQDRYHGKGRFVRWKSMENILAEIEEVKKKRRVKVLHFVDDSFGVNGEWLIRFLEKLSTRGEKSVLLASMRADSITEELVEAFRKYGPRRLRLRIAVECGDETYRREILGKDISDEALIRGVNLFRRHRIDVTTYNMLGLPGETLDQALQTLQVNIRLRPALAICFIYQPFPGTELSRYALSKGFLSPSMLEKLGTSEYGGYFHSRSVLRQKEIEDVENVHKIFSFVARHPVFFPFSKSIVRTRRLSFLLSWFYKLYTRHISFLRRVKDGY